MRRLRLATLASAAGLPPEPLPPCLPGGLSTGEQLLALLLASLVESHDGVQDGVLVLRLAPRPGAVGEVGEFHRRAVCERSAARRCGSDVILLISVP